MLTTVIKPRLKLIRKKHYFSLTRSCSTSDLNNGKRLLLPPSSQIIFSFSPLISIVTYYFFVCKNRITFSFFFSTSKSRLSRCPIVAAAAATASHLRKTKHNTVLCSLKYACLLPDSRK